LLVGSIFLWHRLLRRTLQGSSHYFVNKYESQNLSTSILKTLFFLLLVFIISFSGREIEKESAVSHSVQLKKKSSRKSLGLSGGFIRMFIPGKRAKKLFTHYWTGGGDYYLNNEEIILIASEYNRLGNKVCEDSANINKDGEKYMRKRVNFYGSPKLAHAIGHGILFLKNNELAGFYDYYDFDPQPKGVRPSFHEFKTRTMNWMGRLRGAKPFKIFFGVGGVIN
jgi:hypothetical protein